MKLEKLTPLLRTAQLKETVQWYEAVLGFTCTDYMPEYGYARVQLDSAAIMLAGPNTHIQFNQPQFTGSFYINTNDVNRWWEKLKDQCKVCYEIETFEYGMREFGVYDINGYLLQFGQPVGEHFSDA